MIWRLEPLLAYPFCGTVKDGFNPAGGGPGTGATANLRTNIMDFGGFDSSWILILRGGVLMSIENFPESLSQAILAGRFLVGRLGVACRSRLPWTARAPRDRAVSPGAKRGLEYGVRAPVFHEHLHEACFVPTEISESLRRPPGVCGRRQSRNPVLQFPLRCDSPPGAGPAWMAYLTYYDIIYYTIT